MENTQKTPEQWFQKLKEPYRSEAIANIDRKYTFFKEYPESLEDALENSFNFFDYDQGKWIMIFNSILNGETTYLEPETLTPEQMESGKWYVIENTSNFKYLIKFNKLSESGIIWIKCYNISSDIECNNLHINRHNCIKSIRTATKEEVLKYFPDEVFKPIELRPEDLKAGEVYKATDEKHGHWWIFQHLESNTKYVIHSRCIDYEEDFEGKGEFIANNFKYYHATPEEKALLGEEQTDWEAEYNELNAKYEELQDNYEKMELSYVNSIETQDAKYDALADRYTKLESYNDELKERMNQLEPKGEKVYFYMDYNIGIKCGFLQKALDNSKNESPIYEAVCIGQKKSVLVSETT